jgi:recombination protein RecA
LTDFEDVMARLSPDARKQFRLGSEIEKRYIPTASLGLNMLLGGGISIGHQTTLWGNESAGKSALALATVGINQKLGRTCGLIDVETTFDKKWAARLGVDADRLPVSRQGTVGGATDQILEWMQAGMDLIIVDSTSQLMPKSFYKDGEIKSFDNTGQIGQAARELGQMAKMIQGENFETSIIFVSQVRMDLSNSFMASMKPTGGKEVGHLDTLRVRLFSSKSEKQAIMGKVQYGDNLFEEAIGRNVTWTVEKNKINGKLGNGEYGLYTQGDFVGVDRAGELLDYGIKYGFVEKGGAWITIFGERFQGRPRAIEHIRSSPSVAEKLEAEIVSLYQSL